jgi:hypothetical protein
VKTVLLVDNDLSFAFWLGRALDQAGYEALPARSVSDARSLVGELRVAVDLLVIRASLPSAATLAEDLRRFCSDVRVIGIREEGVPPGRCLWADLEAVKPEYNRDALAQEWIRTVQAAMVEKDARRC